VIPGDPADKGGMKTGDVIVKAAGQNVDNPGELLQRIAGMRPGDTVQLTVWRLNRNVDLSITLGERKANFLAEQDQPGVKPNVPAMELGLGLRPVEGGEEAQALGLPKPQGLLVLEIKPGSAAAQVDIQPGDVIIEANRRQVNTVEQLRSVIVGSKQSGMVMLLLKRQGRNVFRAITLDKQ
ncbi:MAG: PDZ domain-containing protein, partial [Humidesulfovibrio sp.]|nr:PDZ domain-containing protein [Humidesulfovibrio sp.]